MNDRSVIGEFLREHDAVAVGMSPSLPLIPEDAEGEGKPTTVDLDVEQKAGNWQSVIVPEAARAGEFPVRFIDGSQAGQPVLCLSLKGRGWPIPLFFSEIGAVALSLEGRGFKRTFHVVEPRTQLRGRPVPLGASGDFRGRTLEQSELPNPRFAGELTRSHEVQPVRLRGDADSGTRLARSKR